MCDCPVGNQLPCGIRQLLLVYPAPQSAASLGPPATALLPVLSTQLCVSTPPTSLDECVSFNSLVVRLPYSSIFCQFWLFLFLNCCCPSFGCVRRHSLPTPPSWLEVSFRFDMDQKTERGRERESCQSLSLFHGLGCKLASLNKC